MICPRCGTQNELGARRCAQCLLPFSRGAAERDARAGYSDSAANGIPDAYTAPAYPEQPRPRRGRGFGCLLALGIVAMTLAVAAVVFIISSNLLIKPMVRDAATEEIRDGVREEVSAQIATHAALSAAAGEAEIGELRITQDEINARIDENGDLGPFEDVSVELDDGSLTVNLRAYGVHGTYDADLRAENGTLVLEGGEIDGPLGLLAPTSDLEAAVNEEIAASLLDAGYRVDAVAVVDGALIVQFNAE